MAKLFVSYSHKDKDFVNRIVEKIDKDRHKVEIDEKFLDIGDPINTKIRNLIIDVDFVAVILSSNSVGSVWVNQEIYESLYHELKDKKLKLIPCVIDNCDLPEAFTKLKQYARFHLDFKTDFNEAIEKLINRLDTGGTPVFENENYFVLNIPVPNLEIYMTGELYDWQKNSQLKYVEMLNSYLLFGFNKVPNTFFKHFVICDHEESLSIKDKIQNSGYYAPDDGDLDPETGKRRIWFSVRKYPMLGKNNNNKWTSE